MAKKKMIFNHWPPGHGKGSNDKAFHHAWKFADMLKEAVAKAVEDVSRQVSSAPEAVFGVSDRVPKADGSVPSNFAANFNTTMDLNSALQGNKHGHANAYARHFSDIKGKTVALDYGNLIEQAAYKHIVEWQNAGFLEDDHGNSYDYLYNDPKPYQGRFNVTYVGTSKSARPDFRVSLFKFGTQIEAIYDITSLGDKGHILKKKVNTTTLDQIQGIVVGYEIFYTDQDVFDEMEN